MKMIFACIMDGAGEQARKWDQTILWDMRVGALQLLILKYA